jgi:hypothetical protein
VTPISAGRLWTTAKTACPGDTKLNAVSEGYADYRLAGFLLFLGPDGPFPFRKDRTCRLEAHMATTTVENWAYQYTLACAKLTNSLNTAGTSNSRNTDIATAKTAFNDTMTSLLPDSVTSSTQYQYYDALKTYNTSMATADTSTKRWAALDSLYTTLSGITVPASTITVTSGATWNQCVASSANIINTISANATTNLKTVLSNAGMDTSSITTPTYSDASVSAYLAGLFAASSGVAPTEYMNATLMGYLIANGTTSTG